MSKRSALASSLLIASLCWASASTAAGWISVPSTPDASDRVTISGGNLAANSVVKVRIEHPNGMNTEQAEVVGADGKFSLTYVPSMPGGYKVQVLDAAGAPIGGGSFGHIR
ncbi:MAG: hypothetical protein IT531_05675 [Burkholderiales bacterium]|nr:hypothetical protein [Burkholderiales bacterium]